MSIIQYTAVGRRKRAVARVFLRPGSGKIVVNKKPVEEYFFNRDFWLNRILEPLLKTSTLDKFNILVTVHGGGISGQADAIRLGIARALIEFNQNNRIVLKASGLLTRDAREVERKHYHKHKARKSSQYSKR